MFVAMVTTVFAGGADVVGLQVQSNMDTLLQGAAPRPLPATTSSRTLGQVGLCSHHTQGISMSVIFYSRIA